MRSLSVLVTACLAAACAVPQAWAQPSANAEICVAADAGAYSPEQRIAACTALIDAAKDEPGELAPALINRGSVYYYINKMPAALADFDRAIALDPKNARAFRERSNSFRTTGRLDKALADANEAVRLDPSDAKAFDNRGNVFNNNRQFDRAIEDYNEAIRLDAKFAQAWRDRGAAYYFKEDYVAAVKDYDEAIRLDPKSARAFTNRGAVYKKQGRNDRAIADFNEAIRIKPQANFLTNRGDAYNLKGEVDRAIADYDRALALNPGFYLAYHNRAAAWHKKGDLDRAIADYEQALRVNPKFDSAAENLAEVREERDRRGSLTQHMLPTFNCKTASRAVEKAICSDPDLSRLDRQMDDAYKAAMSRLDKKGVARLREEQRDFVINRNTSFGRPEYNLRREMERRLVALRQMAARNN